jgi:translation initiation factor 6 (eIF-6)
MKKIILFLLLILTVSFDSQNDECKQVEWFKFRIHYGFVNAGYTSVKDAIVNNSFSRYW